MPTYIITQKPSTPQIQSGLTCDVLHQAQQQAQLQAQQEAQQRQQQEAQQRAQQEAQQRQQQQQAPMLRFQQPPPPPQQQLVRYYRTSMLLTRHNLPFKHNVDEACGRAVSV